MAADKREAKFDRELQLEAYLFDGMTEAFPSHFHEYYVIGLVESGQRRLTVNGDEYPMGPGDILTFNPMDSHGCVQADGGRLTYRGLNLKHDTMVSVFHDIGGHGGLPRFPGPILYRSDMGALFRELHDAIMHEETGFRREELSLLLMRQLYTDHALAGHEPGNKETREEIERVCAHLEKHHAKRITLEELGRIAHLNKYTLLRSFARSKGITPYRYLETVRINKAKRLLEEGVEPADAAQRTGFSDRSHFTRFFKQFIGLSPKQYQAVFTEEQ